MYKQAAQLKLRFKTGVGALTVEQLYDLPLSHLEAAIRVVKKELKKDDDDELAFLETGNKGNPTNQLRFDILKDVYLTRKKEAEDARTALEIKEHNQKILGLIAEKKDDSLKGMSVEELEKLLK